jgi:hypothetical protein
MFHMIFPYAVALVQGYIYASFNAWRKENVNILCETA